MEGKLNIGRLSKAELAYQLKIRGVTDESTVDIMRSTLRGLVKLQKSASFVAPKYPFSFDEDKVAIKAGLSEIQTLVTNFTGTAASSEFAKITAKISHYVIRANNSLPTNDVEQNDRSTFLVQLVTLSSQLEVKTKKSNRDATAQNSTRREVDISDHSNEDSDDDSVDDSTINPITTSQASANIVKVIPVCKWNLTYSGDNRSISLNAFLEKIEETRIARGMTKDILFRSAIDIFSDKALVWYRANRKNFKCWDDLVEGLRDEFLPVDYEEQLMSEIKKRTQGQNESIGIYLSVMSNLFARFTTKISESKQLKVIMKNILPFYQSQLGLVDVTSIAQLLKLCRQLEASRVAVEKFVPPPGKHRALEPDLAYAQVSTDLDNLNLSATETTTRTSHRSSQPNQTCWNCSRPGHRSAQCRQPRTRHCYRCGKPNVTIASCPGCSKNERRTH